MTREELEARIRETPLLSRLKNCAIRIGNLTSERKPPHITIPVQWNDDDIFIIQTIHDAIARIQDLELKTIDKIEHPARVVKP